jgi:hypothetical protein
LNMNIPLSFLFLGLHILLMSFIQFFMLIFLVHF